MKRCSLCGEEKDHAEFPRNGVDPYGKLRWRSSCFRCEKARRERRRGVNAIYARLWRSANKYRVSVSNKRAYLRRHGTSDIGLPALPPIVRSLPKGADHYKEYQRQNAPHFLVKAREWRAKNKGRVAANIARWELENKDRRTVMRRARRQADPNIVCTENHLRRARKLAAKGAHTRSEISALLKDQDYRCANPYCDADLGEAKRHLDHGQPLVLGGSNDIGNLQWLCASDNLSKHKLSLSAWRQREWLRHAGQLIRSAA